MNIIFFDFDGTLTKKDSLFDFVKYAVGKSSYYFGLLILSPLLVSYIFKITPNYIAKEIFLKYFFKGWKLEDFKKIANNYSLNEIDKIIRLKAMERIRFYQVRGHKVVIVSASIECWLRAWCNINRIDLIATKLEVKDQIITGKFGSKNCYGKEKVNRIREKYSLSDYKYIYAYGDSRVDNEMLNIADKQFYKYFE